MFDLFVCTNPVNLTIAVCGVLPSEVSRGRRAWLLYDQNRMAKPLCKEMRAQVIPIRLWTLRWLKLFATAGLIDTVYLPHHRVNKRLLWIAGRARRVALMDDGLDTHRSEPRNVSLAQLPSEGDYYTFKECNALPGWLGALTVHRVCSMMQLADATRNASETPTWVRHILFDSPGLSVARVVRERGLGPSDTLIIQHPVVEKRSPIPDGFRSVAGASINCEAELLQVRNTDLYFGETLLLYFAVAFSHASNRLHAQLTEAQRENLVGLAFDPVPGGIFKVSPLRP